MNIEVREGGRELQAWVSVSEYVVKWFCRIEKTDFSGIFSSSLSYHHIYDYGNI